MILDNTFQFEEIENLNFSKSNLNSDILSSSINYNNSLYDGLLSTQQVNIDFSKFENHIFFNSAVAKTNVAFDKIINKFPFDGTKQEILEFYNSLNGYENYIIDNFKSNLGYLEFIGDTGDLGTRIEVNDFKNINEFSEISINKNLEPISLLDPLNGSLTIEFHIKTPVINNSEQIILQKMDEDTNCGYAIYLKSKNSYENSKIGFSIYSGSIFIKDEFEFERNKFNHITFIYDNSAQDYSKIISFLNKNKISESEKNIKLNELNIGKFNLLIGSGSAFITGSQTFIPSQTFSGSIDELRIFNSIRSKEQIENFSDGNVFNSSDLKLYYKFNEPNDLSSDTSELINTIILDSSGNGLHSNIKNYNQNLRKQTSDDSSSLLKNEKIKFNKILFPGNSQVINLNQSLIYSASEYDEVNPNIITKLIPKHYLIDGQLIGGFDNINGELLEEITQNVPPKNLKLGNVQILVSFLYVLANLFDEIKIFIDNFSLTDTFDYNKNNTASDNFLAKKFKKYALDLINILDSNKLNELLLGEYSVDGSSLENIPIIEIKNILLRNFAVNINEILKSKGTLDSIKYIFRSFGIDPDISIKIFEYDSKINEISTLSEQKKQIVPFLILGENSYISSSYLNNLRNEIGLPNISGDINSDNLLTSGSWTVQFLTKYSDSGSYSTNKFHSLCRLNVTGSQIENDGGCILNLLADYDESKLILYFNTISGSTDVNRLELNNINLFDKNIWNISFGRRIADGIESEVSSSYFIYAGKLKNLDTIEYYSTSSYVFDISELNSLTKHSPLFNSSGSYINFGYKNIISQDLYLNGIDNSEELYTESAFNYSNFKFWSKFNSLNDFKYNTKDPSTLGITNFSNELRYDLNHSSSYEKIRFNIINRFDNKFSDGAGKIVLYDELKNNINFYGGGYSPNSKILIPEILFFKSLPTNFDDYVNSNKIYINDNKNYLINENKFEIQISLINSLNDDIIRFFNSTQELENVIGNQELIFDNNYKNLDYIKRMYFDRISQKLNFKSFFEFYKFIDFNFNSLIESFLPKKTKFKGINLVIQQHLLERSKINYKISNFYNGIVNLEGEGTGLILPDGNAIKEQKSNFGEFEINLKSI